MASPHAALDSESAQLKAWLTQYGAISPHADRVRQRLKAIEDAKRDDKRQKKRAKKVWGQVLNVVDQHAPAAGVQLRKLADSPNDAAALAGITSAIADAAIKDPKLAAVARTVMPMISQLFVDDDDDDKNGG